MIVLKVSDLPIVEKTTKSCNSYTLVSRVENGNLINNKFNFNNFEKNINSLLNSCGISEFENNTQYEINDFVMYEKKTYKFIKNHLGPWNLNDVVETSAIGEIKNKLLSEKIQKIIVNIISNDSDIDLNNIAITLNYKDDDENIIEIINTTNASGITTFDIPSDKVFYLNINNENLEDYLYYGEVDNKVRNYSDPNYIYKNIIIYLYKIDNNYKEITLHYTFPEELSDSYNSDIYLEKLKDSCFTYVFPYDTRILTGEMKPLDFSQISFESLDPELPLGGTNIKPQNIKFNNINNDTTGFIRLPKLKNHILANITTDDIENLDQSIISNLENIKDSYKINPLAFQDINNYYIDYSREEPLNRLSYIENWSDSKNYQIIDLGFNCEIAYQQNLCWDMEFSYDTNNTNLTSSIYLFGCNNTDPGISTINACLSWGSYLGSIRSSIGHSFRVLNSQGSIVGGSATFSMWGSSSNYKIKQGHDKKNHIWIKRNSNNNTYTAEYEYLDFNSNTVISGSSTSCYYSGKSTNYNTSNVALFGSNLSSPIRNSNFTFRLYSLKFYYYSGNNEIVYRNYVPYSTTYGDGCVYDEIENTYYFNKGNSKFHLGSVINV